MEQLVELRRKNGVARITLNRPERLNAINIPMREALLAAIGAVQADEGVHIVVLDAAGRAFCAGQDLAERAPLLAGADIDLGQALQEGINRVVCALAGFRQPVISLVQGAAVGAGAGLALSADIVLASDEARFDFNFARLGLVPDSGTSWLLPRRIGPARAAMTLLQGKPVSAREAADWGLIAELAPDNDSLRNRGSELAAGLAELSPETLRDCKALLAASAGNTLPQQLDAEATGQSRAGRRRFYHEKLAAFLGVVT